MLATANVTHAALDSDIIDEQALIYNGPAGKEEAAPFSLVQ